MAWQRGGDTAATYPPLMAVRGDSDADERTLNEVRGFLWALSTQSGAHLTDYVLDVGTVELFGGPRTVQLLKHCTKHRLLTKVKTEHGVGYKLVDDPDFIHLRSRREVLRARQQTADARNLALTVPVRLRDGDQCRWCGVEVVWLGRKTARSAQFDHLHPERLGNELTTVEDLVVACAGCNQARGGDAERWDSSHRIMLPPARPWYGPATAAFLTRNGHPTEPNTDGRDDDVRPAPAPGADTAPPRGVRPATGQGDDTAPSARRRSLDEKSSRSDFEGPSVGNGSGRAGSGSAGQGGGVPDVGSGGAGGGSSRSRRRGRRGGRR